MIITREIVDIICPKHERTSCSDDDLYNRFGGWTGKYDEDTGEKKVRYPRCARCYLLDHIGFDLNDLEFEIEVVLNFKG